MGTKVGELFVEIAIDAASGNLSVSQLTAAFGTLTGASTGTVSGIKKITDNLVDMAKAATQTAVDLTTLHDITDADPALVQKWELAAERLHISGKSIVSSIMAVNNIQKQMENGGGEPSFMGRFGIDATKIVNGKRAYKDLFDYVAEFAKTGSRFQSLGPKLQQSLLDSMFGGSADDMYRLIKDVNHGKVDLSKVSGLNDKQIKDLNAVDAKWIAVKQDVVGIFDKFLLAGDNLSSILDGTTNLLERVSGYIASKEGQSTIGGFGKGVKGLLTGDTLANAAFSLHESGLGNLHDFITGSLLSNGVIASQIAMAEALKKDPSGGRKDQLEVTLKNKDGVVGKSIFSLGGKGALAMEGWVNSLPPSQ